MIFELVISTNQLCKVEIIPSKSVFSLRSNMMRIPGEGKAYIEFSVLLFKTSEDAEIFLSQLGFVKGDKEDVYEI